MMRRFGGRHAPPLAGTAVTAKVADQVRWPAGDIVRRKRLPDLHEPVHQPLHSFRESVFGRNANPACWPDKAEKRVLRFGPSVTPLTGC